MKVYNEAMNLYQRGRFFVDNAGSVKQISFVLNSCSCITMLKQRQLRARIQLEWQKTLAR